MKQLKTVSEKGHQQKKRERIHHEQESIFRWWYWIRCVLTDASLHLKTWGTKGRWSEFGWFFNPLDCVDETAESAVACPRWCWKNSSRLFQSHSGVWMSGHWQPDTITPKLNNPLLWIKGLFHMIAHDYMNLLYVRLQAVLWIVLNLKALSYAWVSFSFYLRGKGVASLLQNKLVSIALQPDWAWWLQVNERNSQD